jgi:hypothetical protein
MTAVPSDDPMVPLLTDELYGLLTRERLVEGANLFLARQDDRLVIQIMAVSTGTLGVLLASLSDPAELDDPGSLTCRLTPGEVRRGPDEWEYELVATRYPIDHSVVFLAKVRLPIGDLPDVVSRMRRNRWPRRHGDDWCLSGTEGPEPTRHRRGPRQWRHGRRALRVG